MKFHQFAKTCHLVLVDAARDLAVLTRMGIQAQEIVSLAHKCEDLEKLLVPSSPKERKCPVHRLKIKKLSRELRQGIIKICYTALKSTEPSLRRDTYQGLIRSLGQNGPKWA